MDLPVALFKLLLFPGLVYAAPAGWLMLWLERKTSARLQGRIGPPFFQPFYDFVKLMAKRGPERRGVDAVLGVGLPVLALGAGLGALALLPVFRTGGLEVGFSGDVVLLVALLELPALAYVLAGFASRSIYGQVGAAREASITLSGSLPFVAAIAALALEAGSLRLSDLAAPVSGLLPWVARLLALAALLLCLPARLRLNPFSLANAEQEIYAGPLTEFGGRELALWELAHALEWIALTGFFAALALPATGFWLVDALRIPFGSLLLTLLLAAVAAAAARLRVTQAARFYGFWALALALLALLLAAL
jgi:NADH-quinone oxidoreductase subunit H